MYIVNCDGYIDFNPRSHEGSDSEDRINIYQVNISIHAPTRGATFKDCYRLLCWIFQSTLPRGERLEEKILSEELQKFQSTLPRGERRMNAGHGKRSIMHFNPRSHEGSDQTALIIARERWIFQSTLPRGERRLQIWVMKCSLRFQSTLPRGERRMCSHVE